MKNNNKLTEQQIEKMTKAAVTSNFEQNLRNKYAQSLKTNYNFEVKPKKNKKPWALIAIGIAILTMLGLAYFLTNNTSEITQTETPLLMADLHLDTTYPLLNRRKGSSTKDLKHSAEEAYLMGNFETAIERYNKLAQKDDMTIENQFYWGLSLLYNNQVNEAIIVLNKAKQMNFSSEFRSFEEINWYLSLAHIKHSNLDEAKTLLTQISTNKSWKHKEASAILSKL